MRLNEKLRLANSGKGGVLIDPSTVSGLIHWYKADAGITVTGAGVSLWEDQAGSIDLAQGTNNARPALISAGQNGLDLVRFDGSNDQVSAATGITTGLTACSVFYALNADAAGSDRRPIYFSNATDFVFLADLRTEASGGSYLMLGSSSNAWTTTFTDAEIAQAHVVSTVFNEGPSGAWEIWLNGVSQASNTNNGVFGGIGNVMKIGDYSGDPYDGDFYEVLVYSSAVSDADRADIETYLMTRWGIS